jgi:hypothetical protein
MKHKKLIGVMAATLLIGGVAFASWTASGTGTGTAKAGSASALTTVAPGAITTGDLSPGSDGGLKLTIVNSNPYPVSITSITADTGAVTSTGGAACDASTGVSLKSSIPATPFTVPASTGASGFTTTVASAVHMSNASDNTCQSATFTIPVVLSGVSAATS